MTTDESPSPRSDAVARANALAARAKELRQAQIEVQEKTSREVQVMASAAAAFFDTLPLMELSPMLLPQGSRALRRIRHRVLHRNVTESSTGTTVRALLLGRDGVLRLFTARSQQASDLMVALEPNRSLPDAVTREIVEWSPLLQVPDFRPFEMLDKLSQSLDVVEQQISVAEVRVRKQREALESGDFSALVPPASPVENSQPSIASPLSAIVGPLNMTMYDHHDAGAREPEPVVEPVVTVRDLSGDDDSWDWDAVEALHDSEAA